MKTVVGALASVVLVLSGAACASSSAGSEVQTALVADAGGDTASSCSADAVPAATKVMAAIEANSACSTAADCTDRDRDREISFS